MAALALAENGLHHNDNFAIAFLGLIPVSSAMRQPAILLPPNLIPWNPLAPVLSSLPRQSPTVPVDPVVVCSRENENKHRHKQKERDKS